MLNICVKIDRLINTIPSSIIENILSFVPIKDAARTSILSREWLYKWRKIPKLVFDENMFEVSTDYEIQWSDLGQRFVDSNERKEMRKRSKLFYTIFKVLLLHQGPITEFTLFMKAYAPGGYLGFSRTHFSVFLLADLHLHGCDIYLSPKFNGLRNLTSLHLDEVYISSDSLLRLLSNSPLLKRFRMILTEGRRIFKDVSAYELFKYLPVIDHLSLSMWGAEIHNYDGPQELPVALVHLKYRYLQRICFHVKIELHFLLLLIRSSPKLEKIKLKPDKWFKGPVTLQDYSHVWLEHLNELEIQDFSYSKQELLFVKLILAKSPVLKKVSIWLLNEVTKVKEANILRVLSFSPRASPLVNFIVERKE